MVVEGIYGVGVWTRLGCTSFDNSPFELEAGRYRWLTWFSNASESTDPFATFLRVRLLFFAAATGAPFARYILTGAVRDGHIEKTVKVKETVTVPQGGRVCYDVLPRVHPLVAGLFMVINLFYLASLEATPADAGADATFELGLQIEAPLGEAISHPGGE